jgi:hypothetical protein
MDRIIMGRSNLEDLKMRTLLIALMLITAGDLDAMAQRINDSPVAAKLDSRQPAHLPSTSTSPNAPNMNNQLDCDGQPSPTPSVMALLSRPAKKSTVVPGVQCPIPPVPDTIPIEELRP